MALIQQSLLRYINSSSKEHFHDRSKMTKWFDLPTEVKQIILQMVSDAESIIYIPKDRRYKVDRRHEAAHHFHDLLLVSKTFITSEEFAFALLGKAVVTFYCYNQLRRLTAEIDPSFKQHIRRIHLSRIFYPNHPDTASDSFDNFSNISTTLSTNMPELRQIYISWDDYCAPLGHFIAPLGTFVTPEQHSEMLKFALQRNDATHAPSYFRPETSRDVLPNAVASFIGNRKTASSASRWSARYEPSLAWSRPHVWIRRLVQYAEDANIELIFNVTLCISSRHIDTDWISLASRPRGRIRDGNGLVGDCWCNRIQPGELRYWNASMYIEMHTQAQMSTKDWMLRVKDHGGKGYAYHQQLAYELLHAKPRASQDWYGNLLAGLVYEGGRVPHQKMPKFAF